jgi:hypothetical protein
MILIEKAQTEEVEDKLSSLLLLPDVLLGSNAHGFVSMHR